MWPTEADAAKAIIEAKGNKADPVRQTVWALEQFFPQPIALDGLNARRGQQLYDELPRAAARADEEAPAPDSHRSMLSHAKTFLEYCIGQRWLRGANPLAEVEGMGKRRPRGKSRGAGERRGLTSDLSGDRLISVTLRNSLDRDHRNRSIAITETDRWRSPKTVHRDRWSGQSGRDHLNQSEAGIRLGAM